MTKTWVPAFAGTTVFLFFLLVAQAVFAQDPAPTLRLPDAVRPLRYAAELTLRPAEGPFRGTIEIDVEVRRPTPVIWLNARFLTIDSAHIGDAVLKVERGGPDFVGLRAESPLPAWRAKLRLEYRGELR